VNMQNQIVGLCLAIIGFLGTILICGLPMWKVTAFVGANIVTSQVFWEGLWMNCVIQSTGHSQCKAYDSILALPQDLQASRALVCASIGVSVVAIGLTVVGARCTNFFRDDQMTKANVGLAGGVVFIIAGLLMLHEDYVKYFCIYCTNYECCKNMYFRLLVFNYNLSVCFLTA
uniref:Claudin n=1 Tax=Amphiprion ocellaris TaxID=80972 RepID=A0A3Q1ARB3_AMPOC